MFIEELGATYNETSTYSSTEKDLGRDDFLTLLVAQLKHQDPLNPLESSEFSSQLAQYSSLEQLMNINDTLEIIKSSQDQNFRLQALNFIGKEIVAKCDMLPLKQDETSEFSFDLSERADCTALITDSNGYPVRTLSLGMMETGEHSFEWDGRNNSGTMMDPGVYGLEITAMTEDGQALYVETRITGRVTGVNFEGTSLLLYVDEIPITLSQIVSINSGEGSTVSEDGENEEGSTVSMEGENEEGSTVSVDGENEEGSTEPVDDENAT